MAPAKNVVLYHYSYSPYARRIVWYLQLRNIPYSECIQPPILPRPDIQRLGISYRRIPILAIGRDVYHDTRLIIDKLNALFPPSAQHPGLAVEAPEHVALATLFSAWVTDGGIFNSAVLLIPGNLPIFKDPKFVKDRSSMTGRSWSADARKSAKPEALTEIRSAIKFLEDGLLADGREWLLKTNKPTQVDMEAIWPIHWLTTMPGALKDDFASAKNFPKVWAWMDRFSAAVKAAKAKTKIQKIMGDTAAEQTWESEYAEEVGGVDEKDPVGLKKGIEVLVSPTDSGIQHKDRGILLALSGEEIVIDVKNEKGKSVRVHVPRHGFRVVPAVEDSKI